MRKRRKLRLKESINFREETEMKDKCELCRINDPVGLFWITNSHIFSSIRTEMRLCGYCYKDLLKANVKIKRVENA